MPISVPGVATLPLGGGGGGGVAGRRAGLSDLRDGGAAEGEGGDRHERELTNVQRDLFGAAVERNRLVEIEGTALCSQTAAPFIPAPPPQRLTESLH